MSETDISIIIPSFNAEKTIGLCMDAIVRQNCSVKYEIIVVDCSEEDLVDKEVSRYSRAVLIKETRRLNPGIARNTGARRAKGGLLVFLDADIILADNALDKIWDHYKNGLRVFSGAVRMSPEFSGGPAAVIKHYFFLHEYQPKRRLSERRNLLAGLLVIDKGLFCEKGWFKDLLSAEDTELTERLKSQGASLYFVPEVVGAVIHREMIAEVFKKIFKAGENIYFVRLGNKPALWKKIFLAAILPVVTLAKTTRIIVRNIIFNDAKGNMLGFAISPFIYFCGFWWMIGIYRAIFLRQTEKDAGAPCLSDA